MANKRWTDEEVKFLKDNYKNMSDKEISEKLVRTEIAVRQKRRDLNLLRGKKSKNYNLWTSNEIKLLKDNYPTGDWDNILKLLPNRDKESIIHKAYKLKIKKENYFWTKEEIRILEEGYKKQLSCEEIRDLLGQKYSDYQIYSKANSMGLKKKFLWEEWEINFLLENYESLLSEKIYSYLSHRQPQDIISKANKLGLRYYRAWTDKENVFIENNYKTMNDMEMSEYLENRTWRAVKSQREKLGLFKQNESAYGSLCKSTNGDICFSIDEKNITDFFIKNKIKYIKDDKLLKYKDYLQNDNSNRIFDWIIFDKNDNKIFIEYFGMYRKTPRNTAEQSYSERMSKKIKDCETNNINLLCIYPDDIYKKDMKKFKKKIYSKISKI